MSPPRPKGITETAVLMSLTNALGWLIVDWSKPHAAMVFSLFTVFILAGYVVIWFYWQGRNWARVLVLLTSLLCLYNLRYFFHSGIIMADYDWGRSATRSFSFVLAEQQACEIVLPRFADDVGQPRSRLTGWSQ